MYSPRNLSPNCSNSWLHKNLTFKIFRLYMVYLSVEPMVNEWLHFHYKIGCRQNVGEYFKPLWKVILLFHYSLFRVLQTPIQVMFAFSLLNIDTYWTKKGFVLLFKGPSWRKVLMDELITLSALTLMVSSMVVERVFSISNYYTVDPCISEPWNFGLSEINIWRLHDLL